MSYTRVIGVECECPDKLRTLGGNLIGTKGRNLNKLPLKVRVRDFGVHCRLQDMVPGNGKFQKFITVHGTTDTPADFDEVYRVVRDELVNIMHRLPNDMKTVIIRSHFPYVSSDGSVKEQHCTHIFDDYYEEDEDYYYDDDEFESTYDEEEDVTGSDDSIFDASDFPPLA